MFYSKLRELGLLGEEYSLLTLISESEKHYNSNICIDHNKIDLKRMKKILQEN